MDLNRRRQGSTEAADPHQIDCDCLPIRWVGLRRRGEEWSWTIDFLGQG